MRPTPENSTALVTARPIAIHRTVACCMTRRFKIGDTARLFGVNCKQLAHIDKLLASDY
jgi:hypothetical protein